MLIDCDVHNDWVSADVLLPYLDPYFRRCLERGELPGPRGAFPHAHRPWLHPEGYMRTDLHPTNGGSLGSDYALMKEKLLDRYEVEYAILTGEEGVELSTLANPYYAAALAKAHNDWIIAEWLPLDKRFKGSIIVSPQDPQAAAKEIRRVGEHPDMVQVLVSSGSQRPYGDPFYHPIWEAAAEMDLVVAAHLGSASGVNSTVLGA